MTNKAETSVDKAAGKHIPEKPSEPTKGDTAEATQAPGAGSYSFQAAGADEASLEAPDKDQHGALLAPLADDDDADDDGVRWVDEQVALGRRIAVSVEGGDSTVTREEVLPSNATAAQVSAAKDRLRQRLTAA